MIDLVKKTPIPICGLMLACFSLGLYLGNFSIYPKFFFGFLGLVILLLLIIKLFIDYSSFRNALDIITVCSTMGTFSMSLMILSNYFIDVNGIFAFVLWIIGLLLHMLLIVYFSYRYIFNNFSLDNVYPSYWIVYIGISMASISGTFHMFNGYTWIFFVFAFILMFPTMIIVCYRYLKIPVSDEINKPLVCIYTAIYSILIVAYVNSYNVINLDFLIILYVIACICYVLSFVKLVEYRSLDFYPSFSAFSFPFVISVVASYSVYNITHYSFIRAIVLVESVIAVCCVCYVLYKYLVNVYL